MNIRVATIIGARPQIIKSAILLKEFEKNKKIKNYLIHTGQHYDFNMSQIFQEELKILNIYKNLNINKGSSIENIGKTINSLYKTIYRLKIKFIIVFGDTDTTFSASVVARKLNIKLIHIESGLRSNDLSMPEEQNRILADQYSDYLITPTKIATHNLIRENINKNKIFQFGDIMFDTWKFFKIDNQFSNKVLTKYNLKKNNFLLLTIHRQSNTKTISQIKNIFKVLKKSKYKIIFPVHPRTRTLLKKNNIQIPESINIIRPIGYYEMKSFLINCNYVITDSGGIQKEAFFAKKNSFILRNNTEWEELSINNYSLPIKDNYKKLILKHKFNKKFSKNFYGNGSTSKKIINLILKNEYSL